MTIRRTGLQRDVLDLYRSLLRVVRTKPESSRDHFYTYIRSQFRQDASSVSQRDISTIEFMLRKGRRQLEVLKSDNVVDISPPSY
ncbi:hypothetical protein SpCBS45565_g03470 [Spizellomyces sp. 'palustris']|nr:hypothetical protein SpCBS45565_g03470 [Spizellomyces sp. 'palustris']